MFSPSFIGQMNLIIFFAKDEFTTDHKRQTTAAAQLQTFHDVAHPISEVTEVIIVVNIKYYIVTPVILSAFTRTPSVCVCVTGSVTPES